MIWSLKSKVSLNLIESVDKQGTKYGLSLLIIVWYTSRQYSSYAFKSYSSWRLSFFCLVFGLFLPPRIYQKRWDKCFILHTLDFVHSHWFTCSTLFWEKHLVLIREYLQRAFQKKNTSVEKKLGVNLCQKCKRLSKWNFRWPVRCSSCSIVCGFE